MKINSNGKMEDETGEREEGRQSRRRGRDVK
jgi:hypothetical protein